MSGDEYMGLLVRRREEYYAEHGRPRPGLPALLEWFIRPGDDAMVDLPPEMPQPKRQAAPRRYKSAAELTERRDALVARRDRIYATTGVPDRAAANGQALGRKRTARQAAKTDNDLRRYVALDNQIRALNGRIALARAREKQ